MALAGVSLRVRYACKDVEVEGWVLHWFQLVEGDHALASEKGLRR